MPLIEITKPHFIANTENDIVSGAAKRVVSESFETGDEGEVKHDFFVLYGSVIKRVHDRSDTTRRYYAVRGDDLDVFRARNFRFFA